MSELRGEVFEKGVQLLAVCAGDKYPAAVIAVAFPGLDLDR